MKKKFKISMLTFAAAAVITAFSTSSAYAALINVAATANGGSVSSSAPLGGASLLTLIDEVFLPRSTSWTSGTVYWSGLTPSIVFSFNQEYLISEASVQADDNDAYLLEYWNAAGGSWEQLWAVPNFDSYGSGMQTRPNPNNHFERQLLSQSVQTDQVRITAVSGDNSYSLSEVQIYGTSPVPVPGSILLFYIGILGLTRVAGKKNS